METTCLLRIQCNEGGMSNWIELPRISFSLPHYNPYNQLHTYIHCLSPFHLDSTFTAHGHIRTSKHQTITDSNMKQETTADLFLLHNINIPLSSFNARLPIPRHTNQPPVTLDPTVIFARHHHIQIRQKHSSTASVRQQHKKRARYPPQNRLRIDYFESSIWQSALVTGSSCHSSLARRSARTARASPR